MCALYALKYYELWALVIYDICMYEAHVKCMYNVWKMYGYDECNYVKCFLKHEYMYDVFLRSQMLSVAWLWNAKSMIHEVWCNVMLTRMHAKNEMMHASQKWESNEMSMN